MFPTKREMVLLTILAALMFLPSMQKSASQYMEQMQESLTLWDESSGSSSSSSSRTLRGTTAPLSVQPPSPPQNNTHGLYSNSLGVVHVIHTRFMQHQKDLSHLAKARLELMETFTLPSLLQQTNMDFLWIIWMDPQLDGQVRKDLLRLLQSTMEQHPQLQLVVIGSRLKLPSFRQEVDFYQNLLGSQIYAGSYDRLMDYHVAAQTRPLLETTLDADDAIFYDFVHSIQTETAQHLVVPVLKHDYRLFCAPQLLWWSYYRPGHAIRPHAPAHARGYLQAQTNILKTTKECPTGGYTRSLAVDTLATHIPQVPRHLLHTKAPDCEFSKHKCLTRVQAGAAEYPVLRVQSPASVGVAQVLTQYSYQQQQQHLGSSRAQNDTWALVEYNFGVQEARVQQVRARLEADMLNIVLEGMMGICTEGHSCKHVDKEALKTLKLRYKYPDREFEEDTPIGNTTRTNATRTDSNTTQVAPTLVGNRTKALRKKTAQVLTPEQEFVQDAKHPVPVDDDNIDSSTDENNDNSENKEGKDAAEWW